MSLYRQTGGASRGVAIGAAIAALLVGAVAGFALGRDSVDEPTLQEQLEDLATDLRPATSALELVGIEYAEAVEDGEVVAETEHQAARSQLETARSILESKQSELRAVSASRYETALEALAEVEARFDAMADPAAVKQASVRASDAIAAAAGD